MSRDRGLHPARALRRAAKVQIIGVRREGRELKSGGESKTSEVA